MGVVWLAEARGPGGFVKRCVVKELLPELARDPHRRAMFLDEASLGARLSHRNIVQTHEVGCQDGRWFIALELLEGCTVRRATELLGRPMGASLAVRIVIDVLAALDHAHNLADDHGRPLGIVHRDVSPMNVFLGFDGQVKLLDFGVAKSRAQREQTREAIAKGSVAYMSPDHIANVPIDRRADVFAAGVLLRELLTGERVWGTCEDRTIVARLIAGDVPPFDASAGVAPALARICEVAMAADREDRFATAGNMRKVLEGWLEINDLQGSLAELSDLFDGPLAPERARVRRSHQLSDLGKPAVPLELSSADLETDPEAPIGGSPRVSARAARPRSELFVAGMALVATIAAAVSIGAAFVDDGQELARVASE